jgi:hypothetical protein
MVEANETMEDLTLEDVTLEDVKTEDAPHSQATPSPLSDKTETIVSQRVRPVKPEDLRIPLYARQRTRMKSISLDRLWELYHERRRRLSVPRNKPPHLE